MAAIIFPFRILFQFLNKGNHRLVDEWLLEVLLVVQAHRYQPSKMYLVHHPFLPEI